MNNSNIIKQIQDFSKMIQGDPQKMVMDMVQSGKVTQAQLNQAQQTASQIMNQFGKRSF